MTLLHSVALACDALEGLTGDVRALEELVAAPVDDDARAALAADLASTRHALETTLRELHAARKGAR